MHSLPIYLSLAGRPVILIGDGAAAIAKRRLLERAGAVIVSEDGMASIAIVALDDAAAAAAAVTRLQARHILVNAVDRPALCDFTLPAIVDRHPVLIAIGTGGASAGLAKALRQRLEAFLPAGLGQLADALFAARPAIRAKWPSPADRRRGIDAGLAAGGAIDPGKADAAAHMGHWLAGNGKDEPGRLVTIRLRSDDPDDLTIGEARLLGQADRIYHAADVPSAILDRARADAARIAGDAREGEDGLSIRLERA
jgi:uroporphyrin-III C-methyltransferase/precorrin-2 dehydrogenase/sirohydrochlorin ferrochelatase